MTAWAWKVCKIIMGIPFGQVRTYKWVAARAGKPGAARAAGQALKNNPYLLIIPCHRVIKSDNSPGGYALGRERKRALLASEKALLKCIGNRRY
ncbi:MAG: MGMT family protein [Candidatus Omnitrophica bacterium]|jgi:AraC family transcriptional regulator of adaptative response/methylated-DNA-[protein]-cysteine methyltransferase|nr:MGMT family protein [Candidatus Omnitrophota bacterium]MDD5079427.1 MGMT family protein [Candidatus Omnitrophota bacterium]